MLPSLQIDGGHRRWGKEATVKEFRVAAPPKKNVAPDQTIDICVTFLVVLMLLPGPAPSMR